MKHQKLNTTPEISRRMSKMRLRRGEAETLLAKSLWRKGFRYRLNYKKLPGSPDIAITKYQIAIFIDGEFWHGYDWEHKKEKLKANRLYWIEKIEENIARDIQVDHDLCSRGWTVLHFWEKEVKKGLENCIEAVENAIFENRIQRLDLERNCVTGLDSLTSGIFHPDSGLAKCINETDMFLEVSHN